MNLHRILAIAVISFTAALAQGASADQIAGTWQTPNGESKIEIAKCGELYCGTIASMKTPRNDEHNEDAAKRGRPLVGVQIATGLRFDGSTWTGKLYGPERGKTVDAKLTLVSPDRLEIHAGSGIAHKTVFWTRVK